MAAKRGVGNTPLVYDDRFGCLLKLECLNPSGSHKDRETCYVLDKFGWDKRYLITSTGNAGISLSYWAGERATVVVPLGTPDEKKELIRKYGARLIEAGEDYGEAYEEGERIAEEMGLINVSPGIVDRSPGDEQIGEELVGKGIDYVFIPSSNCVIAYGVARAFLRAGERPKVVACVLPDHPWASKVPSIDEKFARIFASIRTYGNWSMKSFERRFLDLENAIVDTEKDLDAVLNLARTCQEWDPVVSLALFISRKYSGRKVVIVTGVARAKMF